MDHRGGVECGIRWPTCCSTTPMHPLVSAQVVSRQEWEANRHSALRHWVWAEEESSSNLLRRSPGITDWLVRARQYLPRGLGETTVSGDQGTAQSLGQSQVGVVGR